MSKAEVESVAVDVDLCDGLVLKSDGAVMRGARVAIAADVAVRDDLSHDHPLYGSRAVRAVLSGMSDCVIVGGRLVQIAEPRKPVDVGDEEVGRVG
jgi:hypothetical protein